MKPALIIFCALSLSVFTASAQKLYKFQDSEGGWHFTDKPPQRAQNVTVKQLKVEPKQMIWLLQGGDERHPSYTVRNDYEGPVEVEVGFVELDNVRSQPALPTRFTLQPGQSGPLFEIGGVKQDRSFRYQLRYRYVLGRPMAEYKSGTVYYPPIAPGESFPISQAFGGEFSHHDEQNRYAVDITMPVGTPVHAARKGIVMDVEDDFFKGGTNKAYSNEANSIRILHDDGSMAVYAHLELETARVFPGMKVETGQLIGYSGNTGFSTGPHLHFAVQYNKGMALISVPFTFINRLGKAETPALGMHLVGMAPH